MRLWFIYLFGLLGIFVLSSCSPNFTSVSPQDIKFVHVVFMNHLDVGFDGINPIIGYAINVINKYFDVYFPSAVSTAQQLRQRGGKERLVYTTHPWLVDIYLNCHQSHIPELKEINETLHCPNVTQLKLFHEAVLLGDISWHAFPFNVQSELLDSALFDFGISTAHRLDQMFSKNLTLTMSQRDVPGLTRSVIPLLKKRGVEAITIGVNGASSPPAVPSAFVWKDMESGTDIIGMLHPGGYGGISISDCVMVPGLSHALAFAFRSDNQGPPDADEVISNFATLASEFPNAEILASTYDQFVVELLKFKSTLPIVIQEIGDTWIHGVSSDPLRLAQFREILRRRKFCFAIGQCNHSDERFVNFDRLLIKVAEHTWGLDVKTFLDDTSNWSNAAFEAARYANNYKIMEFSWREQRAYITNAIEALGNHPFAQELRNAIGIFTPQIQPNPIVDGYRAVSNFSTVFLVDDIELGLDSETGSIAHLIDRGDNGHVWATSTNRLAEFLYQSFNQADYDNYFKGYFYCEPKDCIWAEGDFGKPNVSSANPQSRLWRTTLVSLWERSSRDSFSLLAQLSMKENDAHRFYGAPDTVWLKIDLDSSVPQQVWLKLSLSIFNKTSTRLPEALWLNFNPVYQEGFQWFMNKLEEWINVNDIIGNGSNHMHGIWSGVDYTDGIDRKEKTHFQIISLDSGVVNPGKPNPFPTPLNIQPEIKYGVNFCLYDNIWGTNYIMWYPFDSKDSNMLFRFQARIR